MPSEIEISLLGDLVVVRDGQSIQRFESDKARALLAYLAVENGQPQRREKLAGLLWPESPERRARRNLSQTLYSLRQTLGERGFKEASVGQALFQATPQEICLNLDGNIRLDVTAFRRGLAGCDWHTPRPLATCDDCLATQGAATQLYRAEFLAGFSLPGTPAFEEWLLLQRERFHRDALTALTTLAGAHRRRGELEQALKFGRRAVALDPLWEPARREVMEALWHSGRRSEALANYEAVREVLAAELAVEPDELTRKLAGRIQADREVVSPRPQGRHNLPYSLTPFIGRRQELVQIQTCLQDPDCRLLTILGPGGSGKSRLAMEAARIMGTDFPDGLFLLSLSGLNSVAALRPSLAHLLDLSFRPDRNTERQLLDFLRTKQLLLILDSVEALPEVAELALTILQAASRVRILATSRVRLNVKGETLLHLDGLTLPANIPGEEVRNSDSVRLFLSAARRVRPDYDPEADNLTGIVRICRLAHGLPLAIILATAWLQMRRPAEIADAMAEGLDFLSVEWPDLPKRQRSLRATLEYTWRLLPLERRECLRELSLFRGGFSAQAAKAVAGATERDLLALLEHSFIQRSAGDRFAVHDLMREFVAGKLAEKPETQQAVGRRHSNYFLQAVGLWTSDLKSDRQPEVLAQMDLESHNVAAAWRWAADHAATPLLGLALEGELVRAVEIYALAERFPMVNKSPYFDNLAGDAVEVLTTVLPGDVVEAAKAQGQEIDVWATLAELAAEF